MLFYVEEFSTLLCAGRQSVGRPAASDGGAARVESHVIRVQNAPESSLRSLTPRIYPLKIGKGWGQATPDYKTPSS